MSTVPRILTRRVRRLVPIIRFPPRHGTRQTMNINARALAGRGGCGPCQDHPTPAGPRLKTRNQLIIKAVLSCPGGQALNSPVYFTRSIEPCAMFTVYIY